MIKSMLILLAVAAMLIGWCAIVNAVLQRRMAERTRQWKRDRLYAQVDPESFGCGEPRRKRR